MPIHLYILRRVIFTLPLLIGITLVERTRRVVRFTPLGERIVDKARRILRGDDGRGAELAVAELGMGVEIAAPGDDLRVQRGGSAVQVRGKAAGFDAAGGHGGSR